MTDTSLQSLVDRLPTIRQAVEDARETLLANLVMIGEIPAPTFHEHRRIRFLQDRFIESGLQNCSTDEAGNGVAILPGSDPERNIMMLAHADTVFSEKQEHHIALEEDRVIGPGVADNSLGLAAVATLPTVLQQLDLQFNANLVLMGAARSLGHGDLQGLRFFLDNASMPIEAGLCVEGVELGRLSYHSLGMLRGEISVRVPEEYDWSRFGAGSAIVILNDAINRILSIPLPRKPRSSILLGQIRGGEAFDTLATHADLSFEVRSESEDIVEEVHQRLEELAAELAAETNAHVAFNTLARRQPGGVPFSHPLVRHTRTIMGALGVEPRISPSIAELSTFIEHQIPALTLGVTTGENRRKPNEAVHISPMYTGLTQLIAVLLAIDEGLCHEH